MKIWMMLGIMAFVGLLVTGAVFASSSISNEPEIETEEVQENSCSGCGNGCTNDKNCGLETCAARAGGNCGCNK